MEKDWLEILSDASIHFVMCFNNREEHPNNCIKHEGNYIHKDDIEEYCKEWIELTPEELTNLKTELYAKAKEL